MMQFKLIQYFHLNDIYVNMHLIPIKLDDR